jgi:hypothetical protein
MESEYSTLIDDAACIASSGRWDAVNERIKEFAANPGGPDNVWWVELFAGLCSQVFSEYLKLKRAYQENVATDASEIAWRARNLLELFVWSRYCASSRDNARRLYDDATHDMSGVLAAFKKWGEATAQKAEWFEGGTSAQQDISNRAFFQTELHLRMGHSWKSGKRLSRLDSGMISNCSIKSFLSVHTPLRCKLCFHPN